MVGDPATWPALPPIGRPIANTQIYILDRRGEPAPIGVTGEIYIGGAGVARGYLNRPELTAERFLPDPFHGGRMYKTGDLAAGCLTVRSSTWAATTSRLRSAASASSSARLKRSCAPSPACAKRSSSPATTAPTSAWSRMWSAMRRSRSPRCAAASRRNCRSTCYPAHSSRWLHCPLTPNGKLDRAALPAPDATAVLTRTFAPPQGPIETAIATLWCDLLGLDRVGRHDHFFELGGHSLMAVQMSIRLREALDIEISLRALFENPVLEQLAEFIVDSQLATFSPEEIARIERELDVLSDDQPAVTLSGSTDDE